MRNRAPLELCPNVAACEPGEEHDELGDRRVQPLEGCDEQVRPLDELRLEPLSQTDAVLLKRADDERRLRQAECLTCASPFIFAGERKAREVDADRDPEDLLRLDSGGKHDLVHLVVRHLHVALEDVGHGHAHPLAE